MSNKSTIEIVYQPKNSSPISKVFTGSDIDVVIAESTGYMNGLKAQNSSLKTESKELYAKITIKQW